MKLGAVYLFAIGEPATPPAVAEALSNFGIEGATIVPSMGLWKGHVEQSVLVRIAGLSDATAAVLAEQLRACFQQEAVYFERAGTAYLAAA